MRLNLLFALSLLLPTLSLAGNPDYWEGESRVSKSSAARTYVSAMHTRFPSIKDNYEENGKYYFSDNISSFGFKEVLNPSEEVIFCGPNDQNFSDAIEIAANAAKNDYYDPSTVKGVRVDSTGFSMSPQNMDDSIKQVLDNNSNDTAKGRFCYKTSDENVDYRQAGSEHATYCSSGQVLSYSDTVSGFNCGLELDVPLKVGKTKYLRQLQNSNPTIAQGFVGCYENPVSGAPELSLVDNPDSCSPTNRSACLRTCDWAEDVVCSPADMPRWGTGLQCGAYGTVIFKGDTLTVESSPALSFDEVSGTLYKGEANFVCAMVADSAAGKTQAKWVITGSSCGIN